MHKLEIPEVLRPVQYEDRAKRSDGRQQLWMMVFGLRLWGCEHDLRRIIIAKSFKI